MPMGHLKRRMTIVRLADRRLVVYSAIALDEDEMARIESSNLDFSASDEDSRSAAKACGPRR